MINFKYKFKLLKRSIRYFKQRMTRGWDDSDLWSLDYTISKLILPRLKAYKDLTVNKIKYTDQDLKNLDKMISAFEFAASEERWDCYDKEKWKDVQEGINLFAKDFFRLWY